MARHIEGRALTAGEIALLAPLFGDALDYPAVRIHRARWWPFQPTNVVMAPDGGIWCHPASSAWRADYAAADLRLQALFVHEMTHVWQAQRGGRWFLPLARHPFCRYGYRIVPGRPLRAYGIEQQAEIVAHGFLLSRGVAVAGAAEPAAYAELLPGTASASA